MLNSEESMEPSEFLENVLDVIGRDFYLQTTERKRIETITKEIEHLRTRRNLLTLNSNLNNTCCLNCFSIFIPIFIPRIRCHICTFDFCRRCFNEEKSNATSLICPFCSKEREFLQKKNSWFYDKVKAKFERNYLSEIIRIRMDDLLVTPKQVDDNFRDIRQSESCISDNVFSAYKKLFDITLEKVKQVSAEKGQVNNTKNKEILITQKSVINLLLSSMLQDMKGEFLNVSRRNVNIVGTIEESDVQHLKNFLTFATNDEKNQTFHFNHTGLRTEDYLEQLSEDIINKAIEDVNLEENKKTIPTKLTLAILAKMSEVSEKSKFISFNNNNIDDMQGMIAQPGCLITDENEISSFLNDDDLESLRSFTESKIKEVPLPPVELPIEYTRKLYGFEAEEKFIGGRPLSFVDPDLDVVSMTSSPNINNSNTPSILSPRNSISEDSWRIGERGSMIMKKRIPYGVNDHYGTERKEVIYNTDEDESSCDGSNDENFVMFLPNKKFCLTNESTPPLSINDEAMTEHLKGSIDDPDILDNTNLLMFRRKASLDNDRLKVLSYTDDGCEGTQVPRFAVEPEDCTAALGKPLRLHCVVIGTKPIDVTWYKHSENLVELNGLGDRYITYQRGDNYRLEITSVTNGDHGYYMCMASNKVGFCQKGFRIIVLKEDGNGKTQIQKQNSNVSTSSLNIEEVLGSTENKTRRSQQQRAKLTNKCSEDALPSEEETFITSTNKENSFHNKKKSSLSHRWLLGSIGNADGTKMDSYYDINPFNKDEKIESIHHDEKAYFSNKEITSDLAFVTEEEVNRPLNKTLKSNNLIIQSKSKINNQSSKNCSANSESREKQDISSWSEGPPPFEVSDSKNLTLNNARSNSNKGSLSTNDDILQLCNKDLDIHNNPKLQKRYEIKSKSRSENHQQMLSSGEDVFSSETGESSDMGEELTTLKMPSVKELRKKFASDIVSEPMIRNIDSMSQDHIEPRVQKIQIKSFQERSYVPLSPVPVNRDKKCQDQNLDQIYDSDIRGGNLSSHHLDAMCQGIIRSDHNLSQSFSPIHSKTFAMFHPVIGQKREGSTISNNRLPLQSGSFVSKVVIGSDYDIVSSCSDLTTNPK